MSCIVLYYLRMHCIELRGIRTVLNTPWNFRALKSVPFVFMCQWILLAMLISLYQIVEISAASN